MLKGNNLPYHYSRRETVLMGLASFFGLSPLATQAAAQANTHQTSDTKTFIFAVGNPTLAIDTAPYTSVPIAMEYWKGLNVKVLVTKGAIPNLQALLTGHAHIANVGMSAMYSLATKYPQLQVISLAAGNIWHTAVPQASNIREQHDLKGKTIGAQTLTSASYLYGRAALVGAGLDPDRDVRWLPVGVGATAANALKQGQIDAYASYDGPIGTIANILNKPMRSLGSVMDGQPGTLGLVTTKNFLSENRDSIITFLRGFNSGQNFAAVNPTAAIRIHWKAHPDQKPQNIDDGTAVKQALSVVERRYEEMNQPGTGGLIGYLDSKTIQRSLDFFYANKIIEHPLEAAKIASLDIAKIAAKFNIQKVTEQAKDWHE